MKNVVWKYEIPVADIDEFTLQLPSGADIIHVDVQHGKPQMWALIDPTAELTECRFILRETGETIETGMFLFYQGTFQLDEGDSVFHVFESREVPSLV